MPTEEQPFYNFSGVIASEDQKHIPLSTGLFLALETYQQSMCKEALVDFLWFYFFNLKPWSRHICQAGYM